LTVDHDKKATNTDTKSRQWNVYKTHEIKPKSNTKVLEHKYIVAEVK